MLDKFKAKVKILFRQVNNHNHHIKYIIVTIILFAFFIILWKTIQNQNTGFETKKLWDWMDLLLVPLFLGIGIWWLNKSEKRNEREIAASRASKTDLQNYIKNMIPLLTEHDQELSSIENMEKRSVARTLTLTVLTDLDPLHKAQVLQFIYESELIQRSNPIIQLQEADFSKVELPNAELDQSYLPKTNFQFAQLSKAKLSEINWKESKLQHANLAGAILAKADLQGANLRFANLTGSVLLDANLSGANLFYANLKEANLTNTNLRRTQLQGANFANARLENTDLRQAEFEPDQLRKARLAEDIIFDFEVADFLLKEIYKKYLTDKETATIYNELGLRLQEMGDLNGAYPYLEHALDIRKKTLRVRSLTTLDIGYNSFQ